MRIQEATEARLDQLAGQIERYAIQLHRLDRKTTKKRIRIGALLSEARVSFGTDDRSFGRWRRNDIPTLQAYTAQTCRDWMVVADFWKRSDRRTRKMILQMPWTKILRMAKSRDDKEATSDLDIHAALRFVAPARGRGGILEECNRFIVRDDFVFAADGKIGAACPCPFFSGDTETDLDLPPEPPANRHRWKFRASFMSDPDLWTAICLPMAFKKFMATKPDWLIGEGTQTTRHRRNRDSQRTRFHPVRCE